MQPLHVYSVVAKLPDNLKPLWDLAYNFWFAWNDDIVELFSRIDLKLWQECEGNPVLFLNRLPQETIVALSEDAFFLDRLNERKAELDHYLSKKTSYVDFTGHKGGGPVVAYFSMEFGISPCLPIYSGGLGILAGDHLKSASDLNIPLVGIGLMYQQGYFRQYLTPDGWQQERYPIYDFEQIPVNLMKDKDGAPLKIQIGMPDGQTLHAQIWKAAVGRISLYLLDANISENPEHFRDITERLYGGDLEMRVQQEVLIGIGGVKALKALDLHPPIIHMNEGHSAFAGLERIRTFMQDNGLTLEAAMEVVASSSVFTTHTPVPAGNDRFPPELMHKYFDHYARDMGLAFKVFMALGREDPRDDSEHFCMTVLALRLSRFNNGVSKLHGHVSRNMWKNVWPQYPIQDVPISSITNGIHHPSWVADDMALLFDRYFGSNWREDPDCDRVWNLANDIPDSELWRTHERLRERLVEFTRERLREQYKAKGSRRDELAEVDDILDPQALTIGFARRFATYKRATLFLHDMQRFLKIIKGNKPVQFIFAGKAHPKDNEGKKLIQKIFELCRDKDIRKRLVFLEDYDIEVASYMYGGCDVWMNNPRRPLEACGTSGMKALVNGCLNFSIPDGWWDEAYTPDNRYGFSIGKGEDYADTDYQDFVESRTLYKVLETDIIPDFYDRDHAGLPRTWIRKMKAAFADLGPVFNSHRMVEDYSTIGYFPSFKTYQALAKDDFSPAKDLAAWRMDIMTKWNMIQIKNVVEKDVEHLHVGEPLPVEAEVDLSGIRPEDVSVEIYSGPLDQNGNFAERFTTTMEPAKAKDGVQVFKGNTVPKSPGRFGFTVRIVPRHPLLLDPHSLGLIRWA